MEGYQVALGILTLFSVLTMMFFWGDFVQTQSIFNNTLTNRVWFYAAGIGGIVLVGLYAVIKA